MCENYVLSKKGTMSILPSTQYYLPLGEDFIVELKENHFSSFRWHLVHYDKDLVTLLIKNTFDLSPNNILGRKKLVLWRFKSFYHGKITLRFELYRPWEGVSSSVKQLVYHINIL